MFFLSLSRSPGLSAEDASRKAVVRWTSRAAAGQPQWRTAISPIASLAPSKQVRTVAHQPFRGEGAARFLVGQEGEDEIARCWDAVTGELPGHRQRCGGRAFESTPFHIHRPAAPEIAVLHSPECARTYHSAASVGTTSRWLCIPAVRPDPDPHRGCRQSHCRGSGRVRHQSVVRPPTFSRPVA